MEWCLARRERGPAVGRSRRLTVRRASAWPCGGVHVCEERVGKIDIYMYDI